MTVTSCLFTKLSGTYNRYITCVLILSTSDLSIRISSSEVYTLVFTLQQSKTLLPLNRMQEQISSYTPTKRSNAQHLVEYYKQLLQDWNKKSGNAMQQPMHSYVCGSKF